jgi:Peptidase family M48
MPTSSTTRRLVKLTFLIALPLVLIPTLLQRKVSARKLSGAPAGSKTRRSLAARATRIQRVVDELRTRLSIADPVLVSLVDRNDLVVTVERSQKDSGAFSLLMETGFLDTLTDGEIEAVVAHELGHVWIFTHHPYLHTEELANQIAMRIVNRETLAEVYEKVWKRTGPRKGDLVYFPSLEPRLDKPEP